jgi:hypothetical protein
MKKQHFPVPVLVRDRRDGESVIEENKDAIAAEMLLLASARITDIVSWDENGIVTVKPSAEVGAASLAALKKVTAITRTMGEGDNEVVEHRLEFEMHDKAGMLKTLAKGAGLLDRVKKPPGGGFKGITVTPPPEAEFVPAQPLKAKVE